MSDITVNGIKVTADEALALVRAQAEIAAREAREAAQAVALAAAMADLDAECAAEDAALSARLLAEAETEARLERETADWCAEMAAQLKAGQVEGAADQLRARVEAWHAVAFPQGCPNSCEACQQRLGGAR